ncbi:MAG: replicative DNA helicase, partial [Flavobacteriales bacterium]
MSEDRQKQGSQAFQGARKRNINGPQGVIPPQALELEEAVLGAALIEKSALNEVIDILKPEAFYKESHQEIYRAIMHLFGDDQPIDMLTVSAQLRKAGKIDMAGGDYYIAQLTQKITSSAHIEFHARIILQKYIQRELIRVS